MTIILRFPAYKKEFEVEVPNGLAPAIKQLADEEGVEVRDKLEELLNGWAESVIADTGHDE